MYTKNFYELIYSSDIQEDFIFKLKIHHNIFSKSIKSGTIYLDKYIFTDQPVEGAKICNISEGDIIAMLEKDRLEVKKKEGIKVKRKVILIAENDKNNIKLFDSISDCIAFLNTIAPSNKTTLYRYIKSGKSYHGFIGQWESKKTTHIANKSIRRVYNSYANR